jgi:tetratricopeptide (TPR) repeat protein
MDGNVTLFDVPTRRLREVQNALSSLDIVGARGLMDTLVGRYPDHAAVRREAEIVRFFDETFAAYARPSQLFGRFSAFKKLLKELSYVPEYLSDLERAYYGRIVDAFGEAPVEPIYGYPPGYLLLKAGRLDQAHESLLQEASRASSTPKKLAQIEGYLGDLFAARGEVGEARHYYARAILTDWTGIDAKGLLDDDVRALILGTYIPEGMGGIWAASVGHILMVFSPRTFGDPADAIGFFKEFNRLRSAVEKDDSEETAGRLFYQALIMVENEELFRAVKGVDLMEVRKVMRRVNPVLFRFYNKARLSRTDGKDLPRDEG